MEIVQHIAKLMMFLAVCSTGYEIISDGTRHNLNEWLYRNLNTRSFVSAAGLLFLSVVGIHLFTNFAGYITPIVAGFLLGVPYAILLFAAFSQHFALGIFLAIPIAFVTAGIAWFLSWITPQILLDNALLPYSAFSSLAAEADSAAIQWIVPSVVMDDFNTKFASVNEVLKSANDPESVPWYLKIFSGRYWWNKIYHANTDFPLLISTIGTQLAYFYSLFLVVKLAILALLFPLFQAADAVKKRTGVEKGHFPIMGIILGICGGTIEYGAFLLSDQ